MRFSFNLLSIKGLYIFQALLALPQEALHKRHLVYCVRTCIMSVFCGTVAVKLQPCHSQLTLYASNIPNAVCLVLPEDGQVMLETCRGLWFSINWMKCASRCFQCTDAISCLLYIGEEIYFNGKYLFIHGQFEHWRSIGFYMDVGKYFPDYTASHFRIAFDMQSGILFYGHADWPHVP
jgi:hypothetical protein